ncbi:hypothetical protein E7Y31_10190 [Candidatus Frankia alpina]|uniref:Uncharacterized protein n=1 Tax=Candidatus Frankia alpina TaxID=2699483 RepID=A0A4S5EQN1_9ACTN|nr:hypothetical protein E7Y31_10190 [Candidatus Frankia alpina]
MSPAPVDVRQRAAGQARAPLPPAIARTTIAGGDVHSWAGPGQGGAGRFALRHLQVRSDRTGV